MAAMMLAHVLCRCQPATLERLALARHQSLNDIIADC
jgi:hypothetical protein